MRSTVQRESWAQNTQKMNHIIFTRGYVTFSWLISIIFYVIIYSVMLRHRFTHFTTWFCKKRSLSKKTADAAINEHVRIVIVVYSTKDQFYQTAFRMEIRKRKNYNSCSKTLTTGATTLKIYLYCSRAVQKTTLLEIMFCFYLVTIMCLPTMVCYCHLLQMHKY